MNTIKVKNIAELKTRKGTPESVVEVLGYYTEGDGGGGSFYWNNTSTETDNGGTIFQVTSVATGRWKRIYDKEVSVRWFGAKGDNVNDDTVSFQKAIDTYTNVLIPPGAYILTDTINITNVLQNIYGVESSYLGYSTANIYAKLNDKPVFYFRESASYGSFKHINVRGFSGYSPKYGLFAGSLTRTGSVIGILQTTIDSCLFGENLQTGVYFSGSFLGKIENCDFHGSTIGIVLSDWCNDVRVYNNHFHTFTTGIVVKYQNLGNTISNGIPNGNIYINQNMFEAISSTTGYLIDISAANTSYITNNLTGSGGKIRIKYEITDDYISGITLNNNKIYGNNSEIIIDSQSRTLQDSRGFIISENIVDKITLTSFGKIRGENLYEQTKSLIISKGGYIEKLKSDGVLSLTKLASSNLITKYNFSDSTSTGWTSFSEGGSTFDSNIDGPYTNNNFPLNKISKSNYYYFVYRTGGSGVVGVKYTVSTITNTIYTVAVHFYLSGNVGGYTDLEITDSSNNTIGKVSAYNLETGHYIGYITFDSLNNTSINLVIKGNFDNALKLGSASMNYGFTQNKGINI